MAEVKGRAGFHLTHTKAVSERAAIFGEAMRELDPKLSQLWAKRNPNIVSADEHLNVAFVNRGNGEGFRRCKSISEPLAYGQQRIEQLAKPLPKPKADPRTGKTSEGVFTTSMFVAHLPKTLCKRVPDFYDVLDESGNPVVGADGKPLKRERWVARDRKQAMAYFNDILRYLGRNVIPGGMDAVLGVDVQFSESTPHIQIVADTFAPDPRNPAQLVPSFSRAYGSHRSVVDPETGKRLSGRRKMANYQAGLREFLISRGWEVEAEVDSERHLSGLGKEEFMAARDAQRRADAAQADLAFERRRVRAAGARAAAKEADAIDARHAAEKAAADAEALRGVYEAEAEALRDAIARTRLVAAELDRSLDDVREALPAAKARKARAALRDWSDRLAADASLRGSLRSDWGRFAVDAGLVDTDAVQLTQHDEAEAEADFEL